MKADKRSTMIVINIFAAILLQLHAADDRLQANQTERAVLSLVRIDEPSLTSESLADESESNNVQQSEVISSYENLIKNSLRSELNNIETYLKSEQVQELKQLKISLDAYAKMMSQDFNWICIESCSQSKADLIGRSQCFSQQSCMISPSVNEEQNGEQLQENKIQFTKESSQQVIATKEIVRKFTTVQEKLQSSQISKGQDIYMAFESTVSSLGCETACVSSCVDQAKLIDMKIHCLEVCSCFSYEGQSNQNTVKNQQSNDEQLFLNKSQDTSDKSFTYLQVLIYLIIIATGLLFYNKIQQYFVIKGDEKQPLLQEESQLLLIK